MACGVFSSRIALLVSPLSLPAPAKINLYLAVTGRRADGFHDLVSLAAPLVWGDTVSAEAADAFSVTCDDPTVPVDASNLVMRAAASFARATGWTGGARFHLAKSIPAGAGLGGASSDAASALVLLNTLAGSPLETDGLAGVAAQVGSDCALFLAASPVVMRGRGERTEPLSKEAYSRIRGMRVLVFKPGFSVPTPWAYGRLAAGAPRSYVPAPLAEGRLASWIGKPGTAIAELLANSMEAPVFAKFPALPLVVELVRSRFGVPVRMSGSGSACFALLGETADARPLEAAIRGAWGPSAVVVDTRIA
jgi:4-diphosphocytidyl-2-C-methyl-D-erythritol kinase